MSAEGDQKPPDGRPDTPEARANAPDGRPDTPVGRSITPQWIIPEWPAPPTVRALSTLRVGGASRPPYASLNLGAHVGDSALAVAKNRRAVREAGGLPGEPSWLAQVHGTQVANLDGTQVGHQGRGLDEASPPVADAAVSRQVGRVCAVLTADCLPVLLARDSGDRVAAAHAGWRGLAAGVLEATVTALACPPAELLAWLGPAIGPAHFEVGAEVREQLMRSDPGGSAGAAAAFQPNERGRFMADLYALARRRLAHLGVARIYGGGECTYAYADRYFSHRRDGNTGRQATLIWLQHSSNQAV